MPALNIFRILLLVLFLFFVVQSLMPQWVTKIVRTVLGFFCKPMKKFTWNHRIQIFFSSGSILGIGICSLVCGVIGNLYPKLFTSGVQTELSLPSVSHAENALYSAIQILTFNGSIDEQNIMLMLSADCAIVLAILVAAEALRKLFRGSFLTLWLSFSFFPRTVICGLGRIGRQLMEDLSQTKQLVIVEPDRDNPNLERARELGAIIIPGDAKLQKLLKWIGAHFAKEVFLVTGNDEINTEAVLDLAELYDNRKIWPWKKKPPKVHVQISDSRMSQMIQESSNLDGLAEHLTVFNALEAAAENFIIKELLDYQPQEKQVAHFIIYGFGKMGQQLALSIAEFAHFANRKRSRMTILYAPDEKEAVEEFCIRYPHFSPDAEELISHGIGGWDFPTDADEWRSKYLRTKERFDGNNTVEYIVNAAFSPQPPSVNDPVFLKHLDDLYNNRDVCPLFILCTEGDCKNAGASHELRRAFALQKSNMPIFAWIPVQPRVADLISSQQDEENNQKPKIIPFGQCYQCCQYDAISNRLRNELARIIHCAYQIEYGTKPDDVLPLSSIKDYDLYWSNFSAATSLPLKLATLGLQVMEKNLAKKKKLKILTEDEVEAFVNTSEDVIIAQEMEHNRWMAERLLRGWKYEALPEGYDPYAKEGESDEETKARKAKWEIYKAGMTDRRTRHQFVPFNKLHEKEGAKDDSQVTIMLKYCSGYYGEKFSEKKLCLIRLNDIPDDARQ